jgi:hypothetical protein
MKGENVGVDILWAWPQGTKSTSHALIRDIPLNQGVVGPAASPIIHANQRLVLKKWNPKTEGPIPLGVTAVGCTTAVRRRPAEPLCRRCLRFKYDKQPKGVYPFALYLS